MELQMQIFADMLEFEKAAEFRDQLRKLREKFYGDNVDDLNT